MWGDKGGYQVKGMAAIHKDDEVFEENVSLGSRHAPRFTPKTAVVVKITEVYLVKAGPDAGKKLL